MTKGGSHSCTVPMSPALVDPSAARNMQWLTGGIIGRAMAVDCHCTLYSVELCSSI